MRLINCKVVLKCKWTRQFLPAAGFDNVNVNNDNISFTIEVTEVHVSAVTVLAKENQNLSKLLSIGFERSMY